MMATAKVCCFAGTPREYAITVSPNAVQEFAKVRHVIRGMAARFTKQNGRSLPRTHTDSHPPSLQDLAHGLVAPASSTVVVITDSNVWKWHGAYFTAAFRSAGNPDPLVFVLPPGEGSKSRSTKDAIEDWMLGARCVAAATGTPAACRCVPSGHE